MKVLYQPGRRLFTIEALALWLTYAVCAAAVLFLARRCAAALPRKIGLLLALLPLVFTGKAMWNASLYGPADLYYAHDPWKRIASAQGIEKIANPILSDVSFQGFPWRAAFFEAVHAGRMPLWNRFLLAGNPLLGSAQAGVFHPSTWLSLPLPLPLSLTFSATFTLFLSLLFGFLFFSGFGIPPRAALVGAVGWGFSTAVLFWNGYAEGLTLSGLPLLLLALRTLARERTLGAAALAAGGLLLSFSGGQPEMFFFSVATGAVVFLWEIFRKNARDALRASALLLLTGVLAVLLSAPLLFPVLEAIHNSSEYRARSQRPALQSVSASQAAARLLPAALPFSHGIYGKSPVQSERRDGSGMPLAYAGSLLFPLAGLALAKRSLAERGRGLFLGFAAAGLLLGASAPGLIDILTRVPGFHLAQNYRLVFLASLGLSGLAALGAARAERSPGPLTGAAVLAAALLLCVFLLARGVLRERKLPDSFVRKNFAAELAPLALLGAAAAADRRGRRVVGFAAFLLLTQRAIEMGGTYPTLPAAALAPPLPTLSALPRAETAQPYRIVSTGDTLRPNGSALYGLEDVRGYESIVLDRFADTYPLWCLPQWASFNRVESLDSPFLSFLNVRFAIASPEAGAPARWVERARGPEMAIFENPQAQGRAFVPRRLGFADSSTALLAAMRKTSDFGEICWLSGETGTSTNGRASLVLREDGTDLRVTADASERVLIATSIPGWPGWRIEVDRRPVSSTQINHAFIGFWLAPGRHEVLLTYRPASFRAGLLAFGAGIVVCAALGWSRRREKVKTARAAASAS